MAKRKSTGKRLRFEIFHRDGFMCRYCGKTSAEIKLVVDHVIPVSKGGTDEPENLVTSCEVCNQGKADKGLDCPMVQPNELLLAQEMRERLEAAEMASVAARARLELRQSICDYFCEALGVNDVLKSSITILVDIAERFGVHTCFQWVDTAVSRTRGERNAIRYICGIRRNKIKEDTGGNAG